MWKWLVFCAVVILSLLAIKQSVTVVELDDNNQKPLSDTLIQGKDVAKHILSSPKEVLSYEKKQSLSLKGTDTDGAYPVDEQGQLILSDRIRDRFEYFLSTLGELELAEIIQLIQADIRSQLQEPAQSQALQLLDNYISYKKALIALEQAAEAPAMYEIQDIEAMRQRLYDMQSVRRQYLSEEAVNAFFGFDESYDEYMLSRLQILNNTQLTQAQQQAQIESLKNSLPQEVRQLHKETQHISDVYKQTQEYRQSGKTEDEIFEYHQQEFGQEAAIRLQQVEEKRNQFIDEVNVYLSERSRILENQQLTASEKSSAIDDLKSQFDENEQVRLRAYELMADDKSQ
ncbi:hypothetical protein HF888_13360 [Bermanella marisrubri]|uniref:Lipase chaperone n=1 Tax=Bermanella marisrubri TaxID=207949 RepID=Q1N358_9GAMM|nr:lipase secretion chaperone [Bermanella marisrubri]EAT12733.1 lipase chaperone [Oceanobacter sp. RED65] [Bermanella marisrubri]QIZ85148.1 hypothetical protein HF888_13360 [Bermanella marisrubri]